MLPEHPRVFLVKGLWTENSFTMTDSCSKNAAFAVQREPHRLLYDG